MHRFYKTLSGMTAVALLGAVATIGAEPARAQGAPAGNQAQAQTPAKPEKKPKDQGEYDIYNEVIKDISTNNLAKAVTDLDTWKQKYPDSVFKDDRDVFYLQAYTGTNQAAKAVDTAGPLLEKDLNKVFDDPKSGPGQVVKVLFTTAVAIQQVPNPTPEQLAIGAKAAHQLLDYNTKPEGVSDADWAKARAQLQTAAKGAIVFVAMKPGVDAMAKPVKDCPAAEAAFKKALEENPDHTIISWQLAGAMRCMQATNPEMLSQAVYQYQRAAVLDPTLSGSAKDPAAITKYADTAYNTIHGSMEGIDQLRELVKKSPLPPAGFHIETQTEISNKKQAEFEKSNPKLALWMKIKGQLADTTGEQYFESSMKDAQVPGLRGTIVEGKPACRPKELLVAVPLPDAQQPLKAEITLKLDAALTGKVEPNSEISWEGVPSAFTKEPFMLTMDTEKAKIEGLKVSPCTVAPARRPAAGKKKK